MSKKMETFLLKQKLVTGILMVDHIMVITVTTTEEIHGVVTTIDTGEITIDTTVDVEMVDVGDDLI